MGDGLEVVQGYSVWRLCARSLPPLMRLSQLEGKGSVGTEGSSSVEKEEQWELLDCRSDRKIRTGRQQPRECLRNQTELHKQRRG